MVNFESTELIDPTLAQGVQAFAVVLLAVASLQRSCFQNRAALP